MIAKKLEEKYTLKLNKELESFKAEIQRKNYVSKVRFDKEFEIYQELLEKVLSMTEANYKLFPLLDKLPNDEEKRKEIYDRRYKTAINSYNIACKSIKANSAFINERFYNLFTELAKLCLNQIDDYEDFFVSPDFEHNRIMRDFDFGKQSIIADNIINKSQFIVSELRKYLQSLDVK